MLTGPGAPAGERTLTLHPALGPLFPQGALQRGTTVGCSGSAAMSLALAVAAGPSQEGAWVGVAGLPGLGLRAAAELGLALERLVVVAEPQPRFDDQRWADLLAAMIDGFDVVLIGLATQRLRSGTTRRLQARAQSRGVVLLLAGQQPAFSCDLELAATTSTWLGLGDGHGVARARQVEVQLSGRRMPRAQRADLWLPDPQGHLDVVAPDRAAPDHDAHSHDDHSHDDHSHDAPVVELRRTG